MRRHTLEDNLHVTLIAGYLGFAGIYWLPGVSHIVISQLKIVAYVLLVVIGLLKLRVYSVKQQNIYFWLVVCTVSAFLVSILTTDFAIAVSQARDYVEPLLWLIALFGIRRRAYPLLFSRLKTVLSIFFFISLYPIGVYIGLFPNFYAPDALADSTGLYLDKEWVLESASILGGGFNSGRTGWGVTVATTALLFASLYMRGKSNTNVAVIGVAVIVTGSVASIIVTGARGGTLALVAVAIYGVFVARGYKTPKLLFLIGFLLLVLYFDLVSLFPKTFLRYFDVSGDTFVMLNAMTTGRLESYVGAISHFMESPIVGKGPVESVVVVRSDQEVSVHNLWLRQLAEQGIVGFLPLLIVTMHFVSLVRENIVRQDTKQCSMEWPLPHYVILCGLIMAMVEPRVIIGSFNSNAVFWTAVWMGLVRHRAALIPKKAGGINYNVRSVECS